jgi:anti-sigma28 factor (negative regulator of flagellin synthesis)
MKIENNPAMPPSDNGPVRKSPVRAEENRLHTADLVTSSATSAQNQIASVDRVELSSPAAGSVSDSSRSARIEQIRTQVQQGTYHVSADDIAAGIVNDMLGES